MKTSQHVHFEPEELELILKKAALKKAKEKGSFQGIKKSEFTALAEVHWEVEFVPDETSDLPGAQKKVVRVTISCKDV